MFVSVEAEAEQKRIESKRAHQLLEQNRHDLNN